jgi:branched-subunit amino acid permease
MDAYQNAAFSNGFVNGYLTMDTLGVASALSAAFAGREGRVFQAHHAVTGYNL